MLSTTTGTHLWFNGQAVAIQSGGRAVFSVSLQVLHPQLQRVNAHRRRSFWQVAFRIFCNGDVAAFNGGFGTQVLAEQGIGVGLDKLSDSRAFRRNALRGESAEIGGRYASRWAQTPGFHGMLDGLPLVADLQICTGGQ